MKKTRKKWSRVKRWRTWTDSALAPRGPKDREFRKNYMASGSYQTRATIREHSHLLARFGLDHSEKVEVNGMARHENNGPREEALRKAHRKANAMDHEIVHVHTEESLLLFWFDERIAGRSTISFFFVRRRGNKLNRSMDYSSKERAMLVYQAKRILWEETYTIP